MKNSANWKPSKFIYKKGRLTASKNIKEVNIGSRLNANLLAGFYDANIKKYVRGRLVDLGCGKVPLYAAYKDYITENICVDWGHSPHQTSYLDYECDLSQPLPFKDGEFNTIILSDVLEHIPEPKLLWTEMGRILGQGGRLLMSAPFCYWLHEPPYDYYRYTEFALRRLAESNRFKILSLEPLGGSPEVLTDFCAKHLQYVPIIGKSLALLLQAMTLHCGRTRLGKRISKRTSKFFPLGYFLVAEKQ